MKLSRRSLVLLGAAFAITIINVRSFHGIFDGRLGDPRKGLADSFYASLQLFTISLDRPPSNSRLPLTLQVTRFVAPLIAAGTVWSFVASYARTWVDRRKACRWTDHEVVCGYGPIAEALALGIAEHAAAHRRLLRGPKVVFISEKIERDTKKVLEVNNVLGIEASLGAGVLMPILRHANEITITFESDDETIRWATATERLTSSNVVTAQTKITALLSRSPSHSEAPGSRIRFVSLVDRISRGVVELEEFQPVQSSECAAVVIGDGDGAVSLANLLKATGSSHVAQRVIRIRPEQKIANPDGEVFDVSRAVVPQIEELRRDEKMGNPIYIWSDNVGRDLSLAFELSAEFDDQTLVVVAPRFNDGLRAGEATRAIGSRVRIIDSMEALAVGHLRAVEPVDVVAQLLATERLKHGYRSFTQTEGINALDDLIGAGFTEVEISKAIFDTFSKLELTIRKFEGELRHLAPEELSVIAHDLHDLVAPTCEPTIEEIYPYVVLSGRLPKILRAATLQFSPSGDARNRIRITDELANNMAREIGRQYELRKGTSPDLTVAEASEADVDQALDYAVKLAALGYRVIGENESTTAEFDETIVELLAEHEHHRWCRHRRERGWTFGAERNNANRRHPDLVPWHELSEEVKDLDRGPVRDIPKVLKTVKLGIERIDFNK